MIRITNIIQEGKLEIAKNISEISSLESALYFRSRKEVLKLIEKKQVFIIFKEGKLIAFLLILDFPNNWIEISTIFVYKEYRGDSLSIKLIDSAIKHNNKKNIFLYTKHPSILKCFKHYGFRPTPYHELDKKLLRSILFDRIKNIKRFVDMIKGLPEEKDIVLLTRTKKI